MVHFTVPAVDPRVEYTSLVAQTIFPVTFPFFADTDIIVYVDGVRLEGGYTVSGAKSDSGRQITLDSALSAGTTVTIVRNTGISRVTDFVNSGDWTADRINDELDVNVLRQQDLALQMAQTLRRPLSEANDPPFEIPSKEDRANKAMGFNNEGVPIPFDTIPAGAVVVSAFMEALLGSADLAALKASMLLSPTFRATHGVAAHSSPNAGDMWMDSSVAGQITVKLYDGVDWITSLVFSTSSNRITRVGAGLYLGADTLGINRTPTFDADFYKSGTGNVTARVGNDTLGAVIRAVGTTQAEFGTLTNHQVAVILNGADRMVFPTAGGFRLANSATILQILTATASLDFPSIAAEGGEQTLTMALTGAVAGDPIVVTNVGPPPPGIVFDAWCASGGIATVRAVNTTHIADNPAARTFRCTCHRF